MNIRQITDNKKQYLDLLLLADPQEDMIDRYLDEGEMFVLEDGGEVRTVCVVQPGKNRQCELKNIATEPESQGKGYGRQMIRFICEHYSGSCDTMYVGTGNCRKTIGFYEKCGFVNSHIVANFFVDHYQEPIYEDGVRLVDMVYLKKRLESEVDVKKVVDLALEAGRILLKNGAEIFRVEETITRICQRFHVDQVDIFEVRYVEIFVSVDAVISDYNLYHEVHQAISRRLAEFLDPITGNFNGQGWEIGQLPGRELIYNSIKTVKNIKWIRGLHMFTYVVTEEGRQAVEFDQIRRDAFTVPVCGEPEINLTVEQGRG